MKKRVSALLGALLLALLLLPSLTSTAWAKDYDEIVDYTVVVQPNVDDGSLQFVVSFQWKALEKLPYGQELKIGIPNGSIREETALSDNIERLDYDNSYMYVYLDRAYGTGETFQFSYSWVQEYMYTLGDNGGVYYDYTPGWFDEARVDHMTVTWLDPDGLTNSGKLSYEVQDASRWSLSNNVITGSDLPHGAQVRLNVGYPDWPTDLDPEMSRDYLPEDDYPGGSDYYYDDGDDFSERFWAYVVLVIIIVVVFMALTAARRDGYSGGFGTHYVFVNNLWYPAGSDGKPKPGSVGTPHKPKPPVSHSSGGLGGGHRGGGFGGGGFGGGSHCACASSCACACACACAGGGRAGCSAKNLYGAIRLDEEMSRRLEEKGQ